MTAHGMFLSFVCDFGLGLLLGWLGGLFGIGGGLIAIPALVGLFGFSQQLAQGTALVMIVPNVVFGFWLYRQHNPIEIKSALLIGLPSVLSTYVTALYASSLDSHVLKLGFAVFLAGIALLLVAQIKSKNHARRSEHILPKWCLGVLGLVSGIFSGLFTVGGGLIVAPALLKFFNINRQTTAQGLALAAVTPGAVVALGVYATASHVDWWAGIPMALGGLLSMKWGVGLAHKLPEKFLRLFFSGLLFVTALALLA
jgi:uncharacterized membrane protein YfcA